MPGRITPLITDEIYHIYNRGNNRQTTFLNKRDYQRAILSLKYYRFTIPPVSLSRLLGLESSMQEDILKSLNKENNVLIQIICYCLMPNHFHLILKQQVDNGIPKFLSNFQNSYTRYFNTRHERDGSLFLDQFKAVRVETDEQLVHLSRYIHLNPYTGYVVKSLKELEEYPYSSYSGYLKGDEEGMNSDLVLNLFKDRKQYKQFVADQADYQRELKIIEHLAIEKV